jgi:hypothetical protein
LERSQQQFATSLETSIEGANEFSAVSTIETLKVSSSRFICIFTIFILKMQGGERIIDALDLVEQELRDNYKNKRFTNPLLRGMHPLAYMCWTLKESVKSSDLELALLVLPFHLVPQLLNILLQVSAQFESLQCL